jgi:hypothetical protein
MTKEEILNKFFHKKKWYSKYRYSKYTIHRYNTKTNELEERCLNHCGNVYYALSSWTKVHNDLTSYEDYFKHSYKHQNDYKDLNWDFEIIDIPK